MVCTTNYHAHNKVTRHDHNGFYNIITINIFGCGVVQLSNEVVSIVCIYYIMILIWSYFVILILQPKCQLYWPDAVNTSCTYGNISVTLIGEEVLAEYTIRTLGVKMV